MFVPHAAFANSPAISRFTRCTVPLPTPTIAATLPALRCSGCCLYLRRHLGAAELLPLLANAVEAGKDPTADDLPFLLAEH